MLDKTSIHRLIGAGLMLVAAAVVLPVILDGERPPELDIDIQVAKAPVIPNVVIAPVQPIHSPAITATPATFEPPTKVAAANAPTAAKVVVENKVSAPMPVRWSVQIATFKNRENAERLVLKLKNAKYPAYSITTNALYKVYVGPEIKREAAEKTKDEIKKEFILNGLVVKYSEN